jgi:putative ABC transport system ATP-binding protein
MQHLEVEALHKTYGSRTSSYEALRGITFSVEAGEFVALRGPSGCGKSTLLHIVGAMDRPTSGTVVLAGRRLHELSSGELALVRRRDVGFVFQLFNLLPTLSAAENVSLPLMLDGHLQRNAIDQAMRALKDVGLADRAKSYPSQLSGGEMQRVAIARALAMQPQLVIADEPTGSLDSENGRRILDLLANLNGERGLTILLATHDDEAASYAARTLQIRDGRLEDASGTHAASTPV